MKKTVTIRMTVEPSVTTAEIGEALKSIPGYKLEAVKVSEIHNGITEGSVVTHKNGTVMTIDTILDNDKAECVWYDGGEIKNGTFFLGDLTAVDSFSPGHTSVAA